jgi:DNA-binding response OmpR family regulator
MGSQASNGTARFAGFELDLRTGELVKNGRRTRLQAQPLKALRVLLEHPGNSSPGNNCGKKSGRRTPLSTSTTD